MTTEGMENMNASIDKLQALTKKASELKVLTDHADYLEHALKDTQDKVKNVAEQELPALMQEIGMTEFKLQDGTKFVVKPIMVVTLPKEKTELADEWLDSHGHGGMMKTVIAVPKTIPKEVIEEVLNTVREHGYEVDVTKSIHWQTLQKWAREVEEEGMVIPEDIFQVYRAMKAFIMR
jgi:hypothetical protein